MSEKYPGGLITETPVTPTGPYQTGTASGVWTRDQQLQYQQQGIWPIAGNVPLYIEDVFSTWLYTGNSSTQTITNGIDLAGKGGLVWLKCRDTVGSSITSHNLLDTVRGASSVLHSDTTAATATGYLSSFNSTGFSLLGTGGADYNYNTSTYVSWTFRKQAKFFDVVTYTGTGASNPVAHSLGSTPGWLIIKATSTTSNWFTMHRASGTYVNGALNMTVGLSPSGTTATSALTSTTINVQTLSTSLGESLNNSGVSYVMYLFAHNAGGFGATGTDNVISCGSFTTNGSGIATISLGYEPQWLLVKKSSGADNWYTFDTMRGMTAAKTSSGGGVTNYLNPNLPDAETTISDDINLTSTGFTTSGGLTAGVDTFIYIAIRRGPMKTPTTGTSVFSPVAVTNAQGTQNTTNFPVDLQIQKYRAAFSTSNYFVDRLRGASTITSSGGSSPYLISNGTNAETSNTTLTQYWNNSGFQTSSDWNNASVVYYNFQRAPSFFDEVCYTGTGVAKNESHNLGVAPTMMIVKSRAGTGRDWAVYTSTTAATNFMYLNATDASGASSTMWNDTTPTASVFTVGTNIRTNNSGQTYVAYLFATCAGVSKVGTYTGTGATQTISCGFTGGARFVLVKRTDTTGDWYVWDTARGMVSGTDPSLLLNSAAAEVNANSVYTTTGGFQIVSTAAGINASGGTYIFLAIA